MLFNICCVNETFALENFKKIGVLMINTITIPTRINFGAAQYAAKAARLLLPLPVRSIISAKFSTQSKRAAITVPTIISLDNE